MRFHQQTNVENPASGRGKTKKTIQENQPFQINLSANSSVL